MGRFRTADPEAVSWFLLGSMCFVLVLGNELLNLHLLILLCFLILPCLLILILLFLLLLLSLLSLARLPVLLHLSLLGLDELLDFL